MAVAACDQRLENLFRGQVDFRGDSFRREILGIDFVLAQLIANRELIEEANGVGLGSQGLILVVGRQLPVFSENCCSLS